MPEGGLLFQIASAASLAFVVGVVALPLVRRVAVRWELYDRPDAGLKPHAKPIPYLGGVGIWLGWLVAVLYGMTQSGGQHGLLVWIVVGGAILMLVGLIDDLRHLPPGLRLAAQALVAVLLVAGGPGRGIWHALLGPVAADWTVGSVSLPVFVSGLFCVLVLAGATNSTNLIDGLDGLCGGIIAIAAVGFAVFAWLMTGRDGPNAASLWPVLAISGAAFGASLAFLCFNLPPASMFMGDSGSLLLGFNVAVLMILMTEGGSWRGLAGALLIFGFPIFDTALAIARRGLNGRPLLVGDRSHFYDQLRDRGLTVRQTIAVCYGLGGLFAVLGLACAVLPAAAIAAVCVSCPLLAALACRQFGFLRVDDAAERTRRGDGQQRAEP